MNPIQKALLKVFSPLAYVINEKMATRSGLIGKFGKFFLIGPREYGTHPLNKAFIFVNRKFLMAQGLIMHRYSMFKSYSTNGYHMTRPFAHVSWIGPTLILLGMAKFIYATQDTVGYEPDRMSYLVSRMGGRTNFPGGALNDRTSAHYIEINHIYGAEMIKRYHQIHGPIIEERNNVSERVKKTKYAHPDYEYIPMKSTNVRDDESM
eukprot:CAMPEP_0114587876 /NCGR_PEP_ID=MMETSP0125-20121206/10724_1 /TAXON_ID=485358 ORGANISM="Aristerostoma sp., Strain ATCC 50986" /NCGR_SAMPLE_ID=MMETSP0125 /ASSEMBLY_ACC=CAM_ASM_000245 /LENGTH=206 /DNA_ID=CAMNT_0001784001 /DNA_START=52 /DNA_END=672 /DNA_ORIENTATION=+